MRYLVTGASGFIASHLVEHLTAQGHTVRGVDVVAPQQSGFEFRLASVTDYSGMKAAMRECDGVFHLASVVGFANVMADAIRTVRTNTAGTDNILHCANERGIPVLITSTSAVYGKTVNGGAPVKESDPCLFGPTSTTSWSYAYAKAADECLALAYHRQHNTPVIVARLFNTVGPRQSGPAGFVLPRFAAAALSGYPLTVHAPGSQTRTFCHVRDTVLGLSSLMTTPAAVGEVVNIGGMETISMWDLALKVKLFTESPSVVRLVDHGYGKGYDNVEDRKPDLSKARALCGYAPTLTLDDMIGDVVAEYEARKVAA